MTSTRPVPLPDPALIVLIGAAGSGKSTWAAAHYRAGEIVSSDGLREVTGTGPADLEATADAFAALDLISAARVRRGLTTVIDTLGLDDERRLAHLALARSAGLPAVAVVLETEPALCRRRNAVRDRPVPAPALTNQLRRQRHVVAGLAAEGWDVVRVVPGTVEAAPAAVTPASAAPDDRGDYPEVVLQLSRFDWDQDPSSWLRQVAAAAEEAGFAGIALMDHLIQIPQVGRAWEPIPEPWVTLGLLAATTRHLRLGTLVSPVTFRPAGVLAKALATLDALSGGRAFCGLGAGWWAREHAGYGLEFPTPAARLRLLEQALETIRALTGPGTKPHAGPSVRLPETTCYPRPAGPLPILVGGRGPRLLELAARAADGCNLPAAPDLLDRLLPMVRDNLRRAARDPAGFAVTVLDTSVVGTDRADAGRQVERLRGRLSAAAFSARHQVGTTAVHRDRYAELGRRGVRTVFLAPAGGVQPERIAALGPLLNP